AGSSIVAVTPHRSLSPSRVSGRAVGRTVLGVLLVSALPVFSAPMAPPDVSAFRDSTQHWRRIKEPERVMQPEAGQPSYAPVEVRAIADNILLFQRANGGWPKDYDMLAVLTPEQKRA